MKYDPLFLCRMMMRLYTVAPDESGGSPMPELWEKYREIEEDLFSAFRGEGIHPVPVSVLSDFNGKIRTVMELVFCAEDPMIPVPADLYRLFAEYGIKDFSAPAEPPFIRLAYTGRCYDYETKTRLITDGLQIGILRKIALDIFSLEQMTEAGVSCRLTHEILHVYGVSEEDMAYYKPRAYFELLRRVNGFSDEILQKVADTRRRFERSAAKIGAANPQWVDTLASLARRLTEKGYPDEPEKTAEAVLSLPVGLDENGEVLRESHHVFYM